MYKNKNGNRNNIAGTNIKELRLRLPERTSQNALAKKMQLYGIDIDKNAIQRIESGDRYITDIELVAFAKVFHTTTDKLLDIDISISID